MKHIKSYEQFLNEADSAKEIEDKINKMGEVSDDEKELEKDMKASEKGNETPDEGTKSEKDNETKEKKDDKEGEDHVGESEAVAEGKKNEKHHLYDDRLLNMGLGKVLDFIKGKDPKAYADIEKYIETNFKDMTPAEEGNFFTTMTA